MTLSHFTMSSATYFANSSGVIDMPTAPCFAQSARVSGLAATLVISALRRLTIAGGVPFGAMTPSQITASYPGTPAAIVGRLNAEVTKIATRPEVRAEWAKQGAVGMAMPPDEFARFVADDIVKWEKVVRISGAKADR